MSCQRVLPVLAVLTMVIGCTRTTVPDYARVYRGRTEPLPRLDPTVLAGRRIVLDPGHGGAFTGTQGPNGLDESHVNLGVSLYLWGLLKEAGAEVHLTRSAERDFLSPADSTLTTDLRARVELADTVEPDIFVSIHHNAQPSRDPATNAVETYYRYGDPASRDLAFAIHRHLIRNLGIESGEVRPGNYFVLRNVSVPAVLGESAYLTHPPVEENLKLSNKQRLEAEAYFLGILEYFSRGTPRIRPIAEPDTIFVDVPAFAFRLSDVGGAGIDPTGISVTLNGEQVNARLSQTGNRLDYTLPWDTPNGPYELTAEARNILGNTSPVFRHTFRVELPATTMTSVCDPPHLPRTGGAVRIRARLADRRGIAVADGTPVQITSSYGQVPDTARVAGGLVEFPLLVDDGAPTTHVRLQSGERTFEVALEPSPVAAPALRRVVVTDGSSGRILPNAIIVASDSTIANSSNSGVYFIAKKSVQRAPIQFSAAGFEPLWIGATADDGPPVLPDTLAMVPWFSGTLLGRCFLIDPEGGFGPGPGIGSLGLPGPFVNLQVARYLAEYLREAGAEARLTRTTEETLSPRDVVALTNRLRADRYIEIRHRAASPDSGLSLQVHHFPGSRAGRAMAGTVLRVAAMYLGLSPGTPGETVTFPLQQTACPAIVISMPSIAVVEEEIRLGEPWYQRRQAYALFLGILAAYRWEPPVSVTFVLPDGVGSNWLISLDDTWRLLSGPEGEIVFGGLREREYRVSARRGDRYLELRAVKAQGHTRWTLPISP